MHRCWKKSENRLETVLQAITRVQSIVSGPEPVNHDSLLVLIHALKNEEARNRWISEHSSDSVHNKLHSLTVQLELEKEMATWTGKMKRFI